jgi:hypothetical protein
MHTYTDACTHTSIQDACMHSRIRACTLTQAHTLSGIRSQFGLKNVKYTLNFLANDDVETPTSLVGKKVAPILQVLFSCPTTI